MTKQQVILDIGIGAMGTLFVMIGFGEYTSMYNLDKLALLWGGLCLGYIVTTYLNIEEENDDQV